MQPPSNFPCANCGAHLVVDGSTPTPTCAYCHSQTALPPSVWATFEQARADAAERARLDAAEQASAERAKEVVDTGKRTETVFIVAGLIAIAIAGGTAALVSGVFSAKGSTSSATVGGALDPLANAGDPCNGRKAACSRDKKSNLECDANDKLVVTTSCKGPNGCRPSTDGTSISCDYTLADPKDPCDTTDDACSTDHKSELRCQAGHFAVIATCKGPDACTLTPAKKGAGYTLSCDDHIADVGDPCFDGERTACSSDHKAFLTCTAQKFTVDRTCKKGCTVKKLAGTGKVEMDCQ